MASGLLPCGVELLHGSTVLESPSALTPVINPHVPSSGFLMIVQIILAQNALLVAHASL